MIMEPLAFLDALDPVMTRFSNAVLAPLWPFFAKTVSLIILGMLLFVAAGYTIMGVAKFVRFAAQGIREGLKPPAATSQTPPKDANPATPDAPAAQPAQSALKAYLEMRTKKYRP